MCDDLSIKLGMNCMLDGLEEDDLTFLKRAILNTDVAIVLKEHVHPNNGTI